MVDSIVIEELKNKKENKVNNFTPERILRLKEQISKAYEPKKGISATKLSRILFGYQQAIYKYEGLAYHFFDLVATRDTLNKTRKGSLFFVYKEDVGKTIYPVCYSDWHNLAPLDDSNCKKEVSLLYQQLSDIFKKLSKLYK